MTTALIIFAHQLFKKNPTLDENPNRVMFTEESLLLGDPSYPERYHKQKLWLHRTTIKRFAEHLAGDGMTSPISIIARTSGCSI